MNFPLKKYEKLEIRVNSKLKKRDYHVRPKYQGSVQIYPQISEIS